ncbi:MAG: hypothetical protein LBQ28_05760 [Prevotellaceae bacterium]|jgi:hypothetical protein|nr:hypothetical protein [Prevotellaceae bacterium]
MKNSGVPHKPFLLMSIIRLLYKVDACHIVPFSKGYDISDHYAILRNKNFVENQEPAINIPPFAGKQIFLPYAKGLYPDLGNIATHRREVWILI